MRAQAPPFRIDGSVSPPPPDAGTVTVIVSLTSDTDARCPSSWVWHLRVSGRRGEQWSLAQPLRTATAALAVTGRPGQLTLLVVQCQGRPGYRLHGPFRWPSRAGAIRVDSSIRRTVRIPGLPAGSTPRIHVARSASGDGIRRWPRCRSTPAHDGECIGVAVDRSAIVAVSTNRQGMTGIAWSVVVPNRATQETVRLVFTDWARLVEIQGVDPAGATVTVRRERRSGRYSGSSRVVLDPDPEATVITVGDQHWLAGVGSTTSRWVQIEAPGAATSRQALGPIVSQDPFIPFSAPLAPAIVVRGRVVDEAGQTVADAVVSVFELIDRGQVGMSASSQKRDAPDPVRRPIAEATSAHNGEFSVEGLSPGTYEILAVHRRLGRASMTRRMDGRAVVLRLEASSRVTGRVWAEQAPAAGVPIRWIPDAAVYQASLDPIALITPEAVTDGDGRFDHALPPNGGGELRIGGPQSGHLRHAFANVADLARSVDLGDLQLPRRRTATVWLSHSGCELVATGPLGSLGISSIRSRADGIGRAHRLPLPAPGFWWLSATCAGRPVTLVPSFVQVADDEQAVVREVTVGGVQDSEPPG